MSKDEAMRQACSDAVIYGMGLVKVTLAVGGFNYTRLDPSEVFIQIYPRQEDPAERKVGMNPALGAGFGGGPANEP